MNYTLELEDYTDIQKEWRDNRGEPGQYQHDVEVPAKRYRFDIPKHGIQILLRPTGSAEIYAELYIEMLKAKRKYFKNENLKRDQKLKYIYMGRVAELNKLSYLRCYPGHDIPMTIKENDRIGDPVRAAIKRIFPNEEGI